MPPRAGLLSTVGWGVVASFGGHDHSFFLERIYDLGYLFGIHFLDLATSPGLTGFPPFSWRRGRPFLIPAFCFPCPKSKSLGVSASMEADLTMIIGWVNLSSPGVGLESSLLTGDGFATNVGVIADFCAKEQRHAGRLPQGDHEQRRTPIVLRPLVRETNSD